MTLPAYSMCLIACLGQQSPEVVRPFMKPMDFDPKLIALDWPVLRAGFMSLIPISFMVLVFGAAFGLAATQTGMKNWEAMLMSAFVFAGVAQFAALDSWGAQVPILSLAVTVFAINARHILMGASLYPWLMHMPVKSRYGVMVLASDVNWAMTLQAFNQSKPGLGILLGGGLALWIFWAIGTWVGLIFGSVISNAKAWGLDMVMGCFLWAMTLSGPRTPRILWIWLAAALAAMLAYRYLPSNLHVISGALAGGLVGAFWPEESTRDH